jgi:hypothetical protein
MRYRLTRMSIAPAFEALKAQADALYVVGDALVPVSRPLCRGLR